MQFPERLLPDANEVALKMQTKLQQTVYVMADSSYERYVLFRVCVCELFCYQTNFSCCIDYVTAAHVNADAIIHYGPKCFSKPTEEIPCLKVNEKHEIDLVLLEKAITEHFAEDEFIIVLNTPYITYKGIYKFKLTHKLKQFLQIF